MLNYTFSVIFKHHEFVVLNHNSSNRKSRLEIWVECENMFNLLFFHLSPLYIAEGKSSTKGGVYCGSSGKEMEIAPLVM